MNHIHHLFGQVHDAIIKADHVLLIAHQKPDGDTMGSSSSVLNWLLREGKDVTAFCRDLPPPAFHFIDNIHRYTNDPSVFDRVYDLVIVFDSGDLRYCGVDTCIPRLPLGYTLINIDHHVTNTRYGNVNLVLTDASSTAEIVHRLLEANRVILDPAIATSLLTGLFTDTSSFSNAATNPIAIEAASMLLKAGARRSDIFKNLLHDKTVATLRLWGIMLARLMHHVPYDTVSTYLLRSDVDGVPSDVIEGASNFLSAVSGTADTVLVLREIPGGLIKGSFRSVNRDISKVAKLLGGGGHKKAAGFAITGRIQETQSGPRIVAV